MSLLGRRLADLGHPVRVTREPGGTALGETLRGLLLDPQRGLAPTTEALLYAAARAQHVAEQIAPALARGCVVLTDRFLASSLAYQGYARGLGPDAVWQLNRLACADCLPDATVYLDLPLAEAARRRQQRGGTPDRIEQCGDALQARVRQAYLDLARDQGNAAVVLPAEAPAAVVHAQVWTWLTTGWPRLGHRPPTS